MTSSILSMHKTLSGLTRYKTDISTCGAMSIMLLGLAGFLWTGWQVITSPTISTENIIIQRVKAPAPSPNIGVEKGLVGLYGAVAPLAATEANKRFYIQGSIAEDSVLLAAPHAKLKDSLVGVLMSSTPEKNIAIVEHAGKQASYGPGDLIAGKFIILKIFPDRVVINENGFYAALFLQE